MLHDMLMQCSPKQDDNTQHIQHDIQQRQPNNEPCDERATEDAYHSTFSRQPPSEDTYHSALSRQPPSEDTPLIP